MLLLRRGDRLSDDLGGKYLWSYAGFPGNKSILAKAFYLDQDIPKAAERTIELSPDNAWIDNRESALAYLDFMRFDDWYKWKYMVEFVRCAPGEERCLEAVNYSSQPLRLFINSSFYQKGDFGASGELNKYATVPAGGTEKLRLSASQEPGPLYWRGTDNVTGKASDFGGVPAPRLAEMPIIKGRKTRMVFTDGRAMGSGRYIFMLLNRSSSIADVDIQYAPYPGDSGHQTARLVPGEDLSITTPSPRVS